MESEETEENVRSGEGHEEIAGVGGMDGDGDKGRPKGGKASVSTGSSIGCGAGRMDGWRIEGVTEEVDVVRIGTRISVQRNKDRP